MEITKFFSTEEGFSYTDALKIREILQQIPEELKKRIGRLDNHMEDQHVIEAISKVIGDTPENWVTVYYDWVQNNQSHEPTTVFAKEKEWLAGEPCINARGGTSFLPKGVWVVAFVNSKGINIDEPYLTEDQEDNFYEVLQMTLLEYGYLELTVKEIIEQHDGFVQF